MMNSTLSPPGSTEDIHADSALVLAPHYDDEVLGCGGLVSRLTARGATVEVLFLTDSGGGAAGEERRTYSGRRKAEAAAACEVLGVAETEHLDLLDGRLAQYQDELVTALRGALLAKRPEVLLVPSPLEASSDHRATFQAVHHLLGAVRRGDELWPVVQGLRVLTYEVNHPQHPHLLVAIDEQVEVLERAMACYVSQQEHHDYFGASLGLARFRTLTLPPEVQHVEAYCRLTLVDFTTRSPARLVAYLGGAPNFLRVESGPQISVIVRTLNRPQFLREALDSLAASTWRRVEVLVVNDGGVPPDLPADFPFSCRRIDLPENQGRSAAANAGVAAASGDYITFLDDDDLMDPEHLETLAALMAGGSVRVAYTDAAVGVYEFGEGGFVLRERRLPYSRDYDRDLLFFDNYIPMNTLLIERELALEVGEFDPGLPFFEDWDFLLRLAACTDFHHLPKVTCEYRQFRGGGHHILGDAPRQRVDFLERKAEVIARYAERWGPDTVSQVVDRLRAETVAGHEEVSRLVDELGRYYGLNGRLTNAERHIEILEAGEQRTREELRDVVARKSETMLELRETASELRRVEELNIKTFSEIERLGGLVRAMESTSAWHLHEWWQRVKSWGSRS
jgi:LmbE family N-acetylglucosaminyl deacetylase/glycosyltransferase involved in cell wall biosynthesis